MHESKHTWRSIMPKAAINPEVMVHAWSTVLLEGFIVEFWSTEFSKEEAVFSSWT